MNATLLASDNMDDYNDLDAYEQNYSVPYEYWVGKHLIIAHEVENVAITGFGTVDGNCYAFVEDDFDNPQWFRWRAGSFKCKDHEKMRPGQLIVFIECKHVRISNITVSRCRELFQFCTAYLSKGHACIEDVYINNVSSTDTDRMISMFANNGTYVKDVCIENLRTDAASMRYIHQNDGEISNILLKNIEIHAFDRYEHLDDDILEQRGHYIFSVRNASGVTLDNLRLLGDFAQKKDRIELVGCDDIVIKDCVL